MITIECPLCECKIFRIRLLDAKYRIECVNCSKEVMVINQIDTYKKI